MAPWKSKPGQGSKRVGYTNKMIALRKWPTKLRFKTLSNERCFVLVRKKAPSLWPRSPIQSYVWRSPTPFSKVARRLPAHRCLGKASGQTNELRRRTDWTSSPVMWSNEYSFGQHWTMRAIRQYCNIISGTAGGRKFQKRKHIEPIEMERLWFDVTHLFEELLLAFDWLPDQPN